MVTKADERWDKIGDNPLVIISELTQMMEEAKTKWVKDIAEFVDDDDVADILWNAARMLSGDIPEPAKVARVMVQLEAAAIKFRMQYVAYMGFKKGTTDANMKKNHYKELYTGIDRLVDALKYTVK